jgi:hypothetical protein
MRPRRFFCTLADRNYLVRALALIDSLRRHETGPYTLYFGCLDELSRIIVEALRLPNVIAIPLHAIEAGDEPLLAARANRTNVEYYWTLTPTIMRWILQHHPEIDVLTYLDADLYFFSSSERVYDELGAKSILIHEHRFTPELAHMARESGIYNVGWVSFRRDADGLAALEWWRDRCNEWCYQRTENGKFGDQMYLDDWPTRFRGVVVLQNIGAALAPWNVGNYTIEAPEGQAPTVNGRPVVFYHFHSLQVPRPDAVLPSKHAFPITFVLIQGCYGPYAEALYSQAMAVKAVLPQFAFGMSEPIKVVPRMVLLARPGPHGSDMGLGPHRFVTLPCGWELQQFLPAQEET